MLDGSVGVVASRGDGGASELGRDVDPFRMAPPDCGTGRNVGVTPPFESVGPSKCGAPRLVSIEDCIINGSIMKVR